MALKVALNYYVILTSSINLQHVFLNYITIYYLFPPYIVNFYKNQFTKPFKEDKEEQNVSTCWPLFSWELISTGP